MRHSNERNTIISGNNGTIGKNIELNAVKIHNTRNKNMKGIMSSHMRWVSVRQKHANGMKMLKHDASKSNKSVTKFPDKMNKNMSMVEMTTR